MRKGNSVGEWVVEDRDGMTVEWDVPITVDDGNVLRADVFRPIGEGRYPVLLSAGPYGKGLNFAEGRPDQWEALIREHPDVAEATSNRYANWEAPDPEKWVPHGYVCIRVDTRGMGRSPGFVDHFSARETKDLYDCVEWAGVQPWSNGKVGLTGISYLAMNQWQVAALAPPHLAAICPWEGTSDHYRDARRQGGIPTSFWSAWFRNRIAKAQYGVGDRGERNLITGEPVFGDKNLTDEERARNRADLIAELEEHTLVDDYYAERNADLSRVSVPLLSAGNWGGHTQHLRGNTEGYMLASSDQKWLELHGLEHWTHYYTDYGRELQKRFFDYFLKGDQNGWDDVPAAILNIRHVDGSMSLRYEDDWPLPDTEWTTLALSAEDLSLRKSPDTARGSVSYRALTDSVTFSTTVDAETEITGPASTKLYISSSTTDADLFLILRVFDPEGREVTFVGANDPHTPISHGWLRASQRKLDAARSLPYRPFHSHDEVQPLVPGTVYEVDVEIWPTSIVIPAGYTLSLTIQGHDYQYLEAQSTGKIDWYSPTASKHGDATVRPPEIYGGEITIHTGDEYPSSVLLPVIPPRKS